MRYILFLFIIQTIQGQSLNQHLYVDHQRTTLIATHVDSYQRFNDFVFYRKGNKLHSYSTISNTSHFIDWNVSHYNLGPDETLVYRKGNSLYIKAAPYSGKSKHVSWNVKSYFWTIDGTLVYQKLNSYFILHHKFTDSPQLVAANISKWIKGCYGELAYMKLGNLHYVSNKAKGRTVIVQANVQKAFFVNGNLYFIKNGDLWYYSTQDNTKYKLIFRVGDYYVCGENLYVTTQRGLHVVNGKNVTFTGHLRISGVYTSYRGITYTYKNRLYFLSGTNAVEICPSPSWYRFSENGCLYIYRNNKLCYLDNKNNIQVILDSISSPLYLNKRIYYTQKSRRYYLEPALGKVTLCK